MKLFTKTNQNYFLFSLITYLVTVVLFYVLIQYLIYEEVEQRLRVEKRDFINYVRKNKAWHESDYFVENKIDWIPSTNYFATENFKDTLLYNKYTQASQPFRQISFDIKTGKEIYHVRIRKSLIESYKLISIMTGVVLVLLSLALLFMFIVQRKISKKLWKPFHKTLIQIKSFELNKGRQPVFDQVNITEFNELNEILSKMTSKILTDYNNLKQFTENTSHELQTPLALINAKVEDLIQSKDLSEEHVNAIQQIYQASTRISKLHQHLLLLAKIENHQFLSMETISFKSIIETKLREQQEIFEYKQISVDTDLEEDFLVNMNATLADILISNLIRNAIRHNIQAGNISIQLNVNGFRISNTGHSLTIPANQIFERFKKDKYSQESIGLGLSIVQEICENSGLKVAYTFENSLHVFKIVTNTIKTK